MAILPQVGAQAVILGMAAFNANAKSVNAQLETMGRQAYYLERTSRSAFGGVEASALGMFEAIKSGASIAAGALATFATAAAVVGARYEKEVAFTGAIAEATSADIDRLSDAQLELSRRSTQTAFDLNTVSIELVKAGLDISEVTDKTLKAVNGLVVASKGELQAAKAATLVQVSMRAFGADVETAVDAATAAVQRSALTFSGFSDAVRQGGSVAAKQGLTFQEFAAAVGTVGKQLQVGTEVGTGLRMMFLRLQDPSRDAIEQMKAYGISLYEEGTGRARPFIDVLRSLERQFGRDAIASGKLSEAQRDQALAMLFGARAVKTVSVLIEEGTESYLDMLAATERLSAADIADRILGATANQAKMLRNNVMALGIAFGQGLDPYVNAAVRSLLGLAQDAPINAVRELGRVVGRDAYNAFMNLSVVVRDLAAPALQVALTAAALVAARVITLQLVPAVYQAIAANVAWAASTAVLVALSAANAALVAAKWAMMAAGVVMSTGKAAIAVGRLTVATARNAVAWVALLSLSRSAMNAWALNTAAWALNTIARLQSMTLAWALNTAAWVLNTVAASRAVAVNLRSITLAFALNTAAWVLNTVAALRSITLAFALNTVAWVLNTVAALKSATLAFALNTASWVLNTVAALKSMTLAFALNTASWVLNTVAALKSATLAFALNTAAWVLNTVAALQSITLAFALNTAAWVLNIVAASGSIWVAMFRIAQIAALAAGKVVAAWAVTAAQGLAAFARSAGVVAATVVIAFGKISIAAVAGAARVLAALALLVVHGFVASARAAALMAASVARSFVTVVVPAVISAVVAIGAALAPFLLGVAAIAGVIALVATAWANNWGDIQGITQRAIAWILDKLNQFLDWLSQLPLIGEFVSGARAALGTFFSNVPRWTVTASNAVMDFVKDSIDAFNMLRSYKMPEFEDYAADLEEMRRQAREAQDAALEASRAGERAGLPLGETEPGAYPETKDRGVDKVASALERAQELLRDFNDAVEKESRSTTRAVTELYQKAAGDIAQAIEKADRDTAEAATEQAKRITELDTDRAVREDAEARRQGLQDILEDERVLRERGLEDTEELHRRELEDLERRLDRERDLREEGFRRLQDDEANRRQRQRQQEDDDFEKSLDARRETLRKRQELERDALDDLQDQRERALQRELDAENAQRSGARDLAKIDAEIASERTKAQSEYEIEVSRGVKRSIAQARLDKKLADIDERLGERRTELLERQREAEEDRLFAEQQEARLLALRATFETERDTSEETHARQRADLEEKIDVEVRDRRHKREDEDIAYRRQQEEDFQAFRLREEDAALVASRVRDDQERAYKRTLDDAERAFAKQQEDRRRTLEKQLDQEEYDRRVRQIHDEHDERIATVEKTLAEERERVQKRLAQDVLDLRASLDERIETFRTQYLDRLEDVLRDGGEALQPLVDAITGHIETRLYGIRDAAQAATSALADAFNAAAALEAREASQAAASRAASGASTFGVQDGMWGEFQEGGIFVPYRPAQPGEYQYGGTVPGSYGSRQLVVAHGGERFEGLGSHSTTLAAVRAAESMLRNGIGGASTVNNNYSYSVEANYGRAQPEGSVARDLSALVALTRR